uniref:AAA domain-containing protein n=1 Tax=Rheinheimera sp. TaxID=1869214 RepID=UPI004048819A
MLKAKPEERQLLLAQNSRGKKSWNSVYPSQEGKREIRVSVDTSQLARQRDAIKDLMRRPSASHWTLIQLLQQRELTAWPTVTPVPEHTLAWQVLTDPNFDGCDRQREFVTKALASQDFSILDGPPGTGKTTTILELIMQLVMQGKRVLLSASTHAAINNVLERIKENAKLNQRIFPLRIGDESNAIGVEEYQFDNVFNELSSIDSATPMSKQLMVDASNLVCGTTIGILKLFREPSLNLQNGEPPFDVMIIDECSKTTFQEFIVPARFAKRWVLVGDVRQLSPFTDREQIVANLDNLMLTAPKGKQTAEYLSPELQQACFLLEELRGSKQQPYAQPMAVPVTQKVAIALQAEIQARQKHHHLAKGLNNILIIQALNTPGGYARRLADVLHNPQCLYEYSLYFIEESCLSQLSQFIPSDMTVLHPAWQRTAQASRHQVHVSGSKTAFEFQVNKQNYTDTNQLHAKLLERFNTSKWSEEICWRLEREYWLRLSKQQNKKTAYIEEPLERLFPKSVYTDGRIHMLKDIAFPSILEALSGDGLVKRKKDVPTTLNQGFNSNEKRQRHTTLTFQHRMHPDISAFPREQFYPKGVLTDGSKTGTDRAWNYQYYPRRSIWMHVPGTTQKGNSNKDEVQLLIAELKRFCDWAEGKTKNKKGEPFEVAVLTFYKGQEKALREALQKLPNTNAPNTNRYAESIKKSV